MIPIRRVFVPFVYLTLVMLVACEPLSPDDSPKFVVVTNTPTPTSAVTPTVATPVPVNTPVPSPTPQPTATTPPTPTPYVCSEAAGRVIEVTFASATTGEEEVARLYLPPCFFDNLWRYPYVILFHGSGYDNTMWEELGVAAIMDAGIADGTLPPMVLVMPNGGILAEDNEALPTESYEAIIVNELIPTIESASEGLCLWGSRQGRAIGGISRGGFWAFSIAFRHPELFSAVGGHSPSFFENNAPPERNPLDLAEQVNFAKNPMRIYMDSSANDSVKQNALKMATTLMDRGFADPYTINPTGEHNMDYWGTHVLEYLSFYGQDWPRDVNMLPSCWEPSPP